MPITYSTENPTRQKQWIQALTTWYEENKRDLVWRHSKDPYSIWVSEIMAQQTRISALLPYYERFMNQFPTVFALAEAPIDDVLKAWEGLGYYARAHNLHKTARIVAHELNGQFPRDEKHLKSLPGIGDYTAGAILSIAFDLPVPAVDGNVLRVFARLENNEMDIARPVTKTLLTAYVRAIMPQTHTGAFTQALMELGALVCVPKTPLCHQCPVSAWCHAYFLQRQHVLPVKSAKKPLKTVDKTILLITNANGDVLVRKRTEKLLHGLWEFYNIEGALEAEQIAEHLCELGYSCVTITPIGHSAHTFTHMIWQMHGFACDVTADRSAPAVAPIEAYAFLPVVELKEKAMPTAISYYTKWLWALPDIQNDPTK